MCWDKKFKRDILDRLVGLILLERESMEVERKILKALEALQKPTEVIGNVFGPPTPTKEKEK